MPTGVALSQVAQCQKLEKVMPPPPRSLQRECVLCRHLNSEPEKLILDFCSRRLWKNTLPELAASERVLTG